MDDSLHGLLHELKQLAEAFYENDLWWGSTFVYRDAVELSLSIPDPQTSILVTSDLIHGLGTSLAQQKKYLEAELHLKESIRRKEIAVLSDRGNTLPVMKARLADSLHNLASIYWLTDRRYEGIEMLLQVLNIRKELIFYNDVKDAGSIYKAMVTWGNIMACYIDAGMLIAAYHSGKQAIINYQCEGMELDQSGHYEVSKIALRMVNVCQMLGYRKKALKYLKIAITLEKSANLGLPDELIAGGLHKIGNLCFTMGKYEEAMKYLDESVKMFVSLGRFQDIDKILVKMSTTYQFLGQYFNIRECRNSYLTMHSFGTLTKGKIAEDGSTIKSKCAIGNKSITDIRYPPNSHIMVKSTDGKNVTLQKLDSIPEEDEGGITAPINSYV